jgi:predicted CxxxxCH...CXXCH cytochrome family protein
MKLRIRIIRLVAPASVALVCASLAACMEVNDDRLNDGGTTGGACDVCHSSAGNSAAHAAHVSGTGDYGKSYACAECHPVPSSGSYDGTHLNAAVDVVFPEDGLARANGAEPVWDGTGCSGVYCHGATLGGGAYTAPKWVDESLPNGVMCGDCHSIPPPPPHRQEFSCSRCHEAAYSGDDLDPGVHINGTMNRGDGE